MRQKRALRVYFSMTRRSADCAAEVMLSASSKMIIFGAEENMMRVLANSLIWSRTTARAEGRRDELTGELSHGRGRATAHRWHREGGLRRSQLPSIPRSSEAFSSRTMDWKCLPYSLCAQARIVEVLPVPGGP